MSIYDTPVNELILRTSEELKKVDSIKAPEWSKFAKTGVHKERPPVQKDWWYIRSAAVLRKVQILGPIGVSKLRKKYGGKKNRGHLREEFRQGSGNVIRKVLQQLEAAGLIEKTKKGVHQGRVISAKGKSLLDKVSKEIKNGNK